jgi:eukaryotic-like serine/threonine-protein kinase
MKRCLQCNRVEAEDTVTFCRVDGTPLVRDSGAVGGEAGTRKFSPLMSADTSETRILPTDEALNRPTATTTVLDARPASGNTRGLSKPKSRRVVIFAAVAVVAVALAATAYLYLSRGKGGAAITSVAVLPFENASGNADLDFISDGVSESVIDRLSQLPQLKVIARSSSFRYRGQNLDLKQIANALGVQAVVTGRVVPRGEGYQIRVELVDALENKQLWGENFNRKASDVQILQTDISREIAENLRLRLSGVQTRQLTNLGTTNPQAYESLLKGRFHFNKTGIDNFNKALEYYEQVGD